MKEKAALIKIFYNRVFKKSKEALDIHQRSEIIWCRTLTVALKTFQDSILKLFITIIQEVANTSTNCGSSCRRKTHPQSPKFVCTSI